MKWSNRRNWPLTWFAVLLLAGDALKAALAVFTEVRPELAGRAKSFDIDSVVDYSLMQDVLADPSRKPYLGACCS